MTLKVIFIFSTKFCPSHNLCKIMCLTYMCQHLAIKAVILTYNLKRGLTPSQNTQSSPMFMGPSILFILFRCLKTVLWAKIQYTICLTKILENMLRFCLTRIGLRKRLTRCCHPKPRPPSPSVLGDISLFLYQKEKFYLATRLYFQKNNTIEKVKV